MFNNTLGHDWMKCVATTLIEQKQKAEAEGSREYFPVDSDEFERLRPGGHHGPRTDELMNIMRNYSCEASDGGSQPLRSFPWTFHPVDRCANRSEADEDKVEFELLKGFLPAGHDLRAMLMTEQEAQLSCAADAACAGFTYSTSSGARDESKTKQHMLFKSSASGYSSAEGWYTIRKVKALNCSAAARSLHQPIQMSVQVLQESPPIFVVDDFVTEDECEQMLSETIPKMGRSVVGGGGTSAWRQSYSVNMNPDFDDEEHLVTRLARRKFAFAREVAGYPVEEGVGQEPVNAVYYYHDGDQYRPHCDGECHGAPYTLGSRVASSLAYCLTADRGGYTLFTRTHVKVVPKRRSLLFFGYFYNGSTAPGTIMDNGWTEHTGCPTHEGRKWIATMWYREGVTREKDWSYWSRFGREGV